MTKIKNTGAYPIKKYPVITDFFIGSDSENNGETVNFEMQSIINMASGLMDYIYSKSSLPLTSPQGDGYFETNGITDFTLITNMSVSKITLAGQNLTPYLNFLKLNLAEFTLKIISKTNQNVFAYYGITNITENADYFDFTVVLADGNNYLGELEDKDTYTFVYEKVPGVGPDIITQTITDGDTTHAPSSDAVYDALANLTPVSATVKGIVNNVPLQELGGVDKLINGIRIGQGAVTGLANTVLGSGSLGLVTTGTYNTAIGIQTLEKLTTANNNTAVGGRALRNVTIGSGNSAFGQGAMLNTTIGEDNSAFGLRALAANISGSYNAAFGEGALEFNTNGEGNAAFGEWALRNNTVGAYNVAVGTNAMTTNVSGNSNVAVGGQALSHIIGGYGNVAIGITALEQTIGNGSATNGGYNVGVGNSTLQLNTSGYGNTALGPAALARSVTAAYNIAVGYQAGSGVTGGGNTIIATTGSVAGGGGITSGTNNMILAPNAGNTTGITTGSGNVIVGKVTGLTAALANTVILSDGVGTQRIVSNSTNLTTLPVQTIALITADVSGKAIVTKEYLSSGGSGTVTGTGVAGQVAFWTGANTQSGSNDFLWDGVNKRLGINVVSTPQAVLDIRSEGNLRVLNMSMYSNTLSDTAAILGARIGGTKASPTAILANTVMATFCATGYNGTGSGNITGRIDVIAKQNFAGANEPTYMTFGTSPVSGIIAVERMRIDSDGNVLIGTTTNTGEKFQVNGTTRLGGDTLLTGILSATNTGATQINGIDLTNNGTSGSRVFRVTATSTGDGANFINSSTATGAVISVFNSGIPSGATGVYVQNNAGGRGIFGSNGSNGTLVFLDSATASTGNLLEFRKNSVLTTSFDQNGVFKYIGNSSIGYSAVALNGITIGARGGGANPMIATKSTNTASAMMYHLTLGTTDTIRTGESDFVFRTGFDSGLDTVSPFTTNGVAFAFQNASNNLLLINRQGSLVIGISPTTSAGAYDILTRNTSTGVIEKIASTAVIGGSGLGNQVSFWTGANTQSGSDNFTWFDSTKQLRVRGESTNDPFIIRMNSTASNYSAGVTGQRYGGTIASPTVVLSDYVLTGIFGAGYDGTAVGANVGSMRIVAGADFTNVSQPTYIDFSTTPVGALTRLERMRITSSGNILMGTSSDTGEKLQVNGTTRLGGNTALLGILSATNTGTALGNGISLINSGTGSGSRVLLISNTSTGNGMVVANTGAGGAGAFFSNNSTSTGYIFENVSTGGLLLLNSQTASTGNILTLQKNGVTSVVFDQNGLMSMATNTGATQVIGIQLTNSGTAGSRVLTLTNTNTGTGFNLVNSGSGNGQLINNTSSGVGLFLSNGATGQSLSGDNVSTGTLINLNSQTASIGDLLQFRKNSVVTTKFDQNGILSTPPPIITTVPTTSAGTYDVLTRNTSTGQVEKVTSGGGIRPYKSYVALLAQSGTSAPVATVLENTLGGTVVWTRNSVGNYSATLAGVFLANKCWGSITLSANITGNGGYISNASPNSMTLVTVDSTNTLIDFLAASASIEFRVYP